MNNDDVRKKFGNSIRVFDFMVTKLGLAKYELLIYAYIFSYSIDGGCYRGSQAHLATKFGIKSRSSVQSSLNKLVESGLITKEIISIPQGKGCIYRCDMERLEYLI